MDKNTLLYVAYVLALVAGTGWAGFALIRHRFALAYFTLLGLMLVIGAYFYARAQGEQGWDALGYFLVVLFLVAPVVAGLGLGGVLGWLRNRKTR